MFYWGFATSDQAMQRYDDVKLNLRQSGSFIGIAGIAVMAFLYFASIDLVPWWGYALLIITWLAHLVVGCAWFMTRPIGVFLLPFSLAAIWFVSIYLL